MIPRILTDQALAVRDMAATFQSEDMMSNAMVPQLLQQTDQTEPDSVMPNQKSPEEGHNIVTTLTQGTTQAPTRSDVRRPPIIDANTGDFERMLTNANASYESINHLLDLKQKQANASEVRFARKRVESNARHSNTIMVFTVVTIVFGSLSFVTAFFALNVTGFPPGWNLGHIVGLVVGVSIGLSIPFIVIAFSINPIVDSLKEGGFYNRLAVPTFLKRLLRWRRGGEMDSNLLGLFQLLLFGVHLVKWRVQRQNVFRGHANYPRE